MRLTLWANLYGIQCLARYPRRSLLAQTQTIWSPVVWVQEKGRALCCSSKEFSFFFLFWGFTWGVCWGENSTRFVMACLKRCGSAFRFTSLMEFKTFESPRLLWQRPSSCFMISISESRLQNIWHCSSISSLIREFISPKTLQTKVILKCAVTVSSHSAFGLYCRIYRYRYAEYNRGDYTNIEAGSYFLPRPSPVPQNISYGVVGKQVLDKRTKKLLGPFHILISCKAKSINILVVVE